MLFSPQIFFLLFKPNLELGRKYLDLESSVAVWHRNLLVIMLEEPYFDRNWTLRATTQASLIFHIPHCLLLLTFNFHRLFQHIFCGCKKSHLHLFVDYFSCNWQFLPKKGKETKKEHKRNVIHKSDCNQNYLKEPTDEKLALTCKTNKTVPIKRYSIWYETPHIDELSK